MPVSKIIRGDGFSGIFRRYLGRSESWNPAKLKEIVQEGVQDIVGFEGI